MKRARWCSASAAATTVLKVVHFVQDGVEKSLGAHEIFYALGRVPAVEGLSLEAAGVKYHAITGVEIDDTMRTSQPHIFAVGDVTGAYALVAHRDPAG